MPTYDFACEGCGPFELRRPLAEASSPAPCPSCAGEARRVYAMPNLKTMPAALSGAMSRAEKSAHAPEVARQPSGGARYRSGHGGHCGH